MGKLRLTTEEVNERVKRVTNNEFELYGEYIGSSKKNKFIHKKCNNIVESKLDIFIHKKGICRYCNGGSKLTLEEIEKIFKANNIFKITKNSVYKNQKTDMIVFCNECKKEHKLKQRNFKNKHCPIKQTNKKLSIDIWNERVKNIDDNYEIISKEYKNTHSKLEFIHKKCGRTFFMVPKDFTKKDGNRCPLCKSSKGEKLISEYLDLNDINYDQHFRGLNLKADNYLEFDFKLNLNGFFILIEFDGRLHFEVWSEGEKHYKKLQRQIRNDKIKNEFCDKENIPLFRIKYTEIKNIEEIMDKIIESSTTKEDALVVSKQMRYEI